MTNLHRATERATDLVAIEQGAGSEASFLASQLLQAAHASGSPPGIIVLAFSLASASLSISASDAFTADPQFAIDNGPISHDVADIMGAAAKVFEALTERMKH